MRTSPTCRVSEVREGAPSLSFSLLLSANRPRYCPFAWNIPPRGTALAKDMSAISEDSRLSSFPLKKRLVRHGVSAASPRVYDEFPRVPTDSPPPAWDGTEEERFNLFEPPQSEEKPSQKHQVSVLGKASTDEERLRIRKTKRRDKRVRKPSQKQKTSSPSAPKAKPKVIAPKKRPAAKKTPPGTQTRVVSKKAKTGSKKTLVPAKPSKPLVAVHHRIKPSLPGHMGVYAGVPIPIGTIVHCRFRGGSTNSFPDHYEATVTNASETSDTVTVTYSNDPVKYPQVSRHHIEEARIPLTLFNLRAGDLRVGDPCSAPYYYDGKTVEGWPKSRKCACVLVSLPHPFGEDVIVRYLYEVEHKEYVNINDVEFAPRLLEEDFTKQSKQDGNKKTHKL